MAKLSFIIPAYNVGPYIGQMLASICRNEGLATNVIEIVVVCDGASDDTPKVVKQFAAEHPKVKIRLMAQSHQGASAARNTGLKAASGAFVWFVDGDDMITPFALKHILQAIETHPEVDVINTGTPVRFSGKNTPEMAEPDAIAAQVMPPYGLFDENYSALYLCHVRHIWRKEMLIRHHLRYPVGITTHEDFAFTVSALLKAETALDLSALSTYLYRKHGKSTTHARKRDDKTFQGNVLSAQKALQLILEEEKEKYAWNEAKQRAYQRVKNLLIATNITHLLDPLPLKFVRQALASLKKMGAYPIQPEPDHSSRLRFVMCRPWAIYAVSQLRRITKAIKTIA
ncbi:MAG: glycosyltransferase [Bacteroidales bacterium]|nr:glycosyltransferase [Bacteroidales bacterium]